MHSNMTNREHLDRTFHDLAGNERNSKNRGPISKRKHFSEAPQTLVNQATLITVVGTKGKVTKKNERTRQQMSCNSTTIKLVLRLLIDNDLDA